MNENTTHAILINPQNGKPLAQITIDGETIQAHEVISASGKLQAFTILSETSLLMEAFFNQQAVLLRIGNIQQMVKIATIPTEGEFQGHLEFIKGTREHFHEEEQPHPTHQVRRGLALLQSILGS